MWLEDFKEERRKGEAAPPHSDTAPHCKPAHLHRDGLSRDERQRLVRKTQELHDELIAAVRHVDPAEYSEERIQGLLARANRR